MHITHLQSFTNPNNSILINKLQRMQPYTDITIESNLPSSRRIPTQCTYLHSRTNLTKKVTVL